MKRLFLVFWLVFLAGCDSYINSQVSNDPRIIELQRQAEELHNMGLALDAESKQVIADANHLYNVRIPAFLDTLDSYQLDAFDEFFHSAQSTDPVAVEKGFRSLRQNFTVEQQLYIVALMDEAEDITKRKEAGIARVHTYIEKEKEFKDYCNYLLQANQREYDSSRQKIWQNYQFQQQPYQSQPNPTILTHNPAKSPSLGTINANRYNPNSLANPYGAGSPYKSDGLMNPYSQYGSPYSNKSWRNPYATDAPKLYDSQGNYKGRLSTNPYAPDSTSNPFGRYGSRYSPDSINNPYGAGNPYSTKPIYVVPSK